MEGRVHKLEDGETIFSEGENSLTAYEVVEGRVRLTKTSGKNTITLAVLDGGEIFGEMGLIDDSLRSATAVADGAVTLKVIGREVFFQALRETPGLAFAVMEKLVKRLRHMDDVAVAMNIEPGASSTIREQAEEGWYPPSFAHHANNDHQAGAIKEERPLGPEMVKIQFSSLYGDVANKHTRALVAVLDAASGIRAELFNKRPLLSKSDSMLSQLASAREQAWRWLAESGADLFVWGRVDEDGKTFSLHFVNTVVRDDERLGGFGLANTLYFPATFGQREADLFSSIILAVVRPKTKLQQQRVNEVLPPTLEMAIPVGLNPDFVQGGEEKASIRNCFANACAIAGCSSGGTQWYKLAGEAYNLALKTLERHNSPVEWASTHRQLGNVLLAIGERDKDKDALKQAVDALGKARQVFTMERFPHDCALSSCAIAQALVKLERYTDDVRYLKQGVETLRTALKVTDASKMPMLWADMMHNLGHALQVMAMRDNNESLLNEAVTSCEAALKARLAANDTMSAAASRNNLGSALFMYAKMAASAKMATSAANEFQEALKTYRLLGLVNMAKVAEKNKNRASELLADLS